MTNIYILLREVEASINHSSIPADGSEPLKFSSTYSQDKLPQFLTCLWKQNLVYWRSPHYNAMRLFFTTASALIFGSVFWNVGSKRYILLSFIASFFSLTLLNLLINLIQEKKNITYLYAHVWVTSCMHQNIFKT